MVTLLHPSYGRPEQALKTALKWKQEAGCEVEHIFAIDIDDPCAEEYEPVDFMFEGNFGSPVLATNEIARKAKEGLLLYLSDDFDCFPNWAIKVEEIASKYKGEFCIKVNDGIQKFTNDMLTIPIMSRALYGRLGYFWYPAYKSIYCDNDLYHTCKRYGWLKPHPEITFRHRHPCNGTAENDETYIRSHANYEQGRKIFEQRKKQQFK